jgi:hypothetical protein
VVRAERGCFRNRNRVFRRSAVKVSQEAGGLGGTVLIRTRKTRFLRDSSSVAKKPGFWTFGGEGVSESREFGGSHPNQNLKNPVSARFHDYGVAAPQTGFLSPIHRAAGVSEHTEAP